MIGKKKKPAVKAPAETPIAKVTPIKANRVTRREVDAAKGTPEYGALKQRWAEQG